MTAFYKSNWSYGFSFIARCCPFVDRFYREIIQQKGLRLRGKGMPVWYSRGFTRVRLWPSAVVVQILCNVFSTFLQSATIGILNEHWRKAEGNMVHLEAVPKQNQTRIQPAQGLWNTIRTPDYFCETDSNVSRSFVKIKAGEMFS